MVKVAVIGAGVIGLSSALRIIEECPGVQVEVIADKFSPFTTSDAAGGFWEPHLLGDTPEEKVKQWSSVTFKHMEYLASTDCAKYTGASFVSGIQLNDTLNKQIPFWVQQVKNFRILNAEELSQYNAEFGFFYTTLMLESRLYLQWLMKRVQRKGGRFRKRNIGKLEDLASDNYDIVVNCCGVGGNTLVNDPTVQPVRGQVMRVNAPWIKHFHIDIRGDEILYVLPSTSFVVVGGVEQTGNWNTEASVQDRDKIWKMCTKYIPSLTEATFESDKVGLRPLRPSVRLELERLQIKDKQMPVIHNYGHGGSGVTVHWGCAEEVTKLVKQVLTENKINKNLPSKL